MFSWICPRCGRENRPSDTVCPNCRGLEAQQAEAVPPPVAPEPPPPPPQFAPPPPPPPPVREQRPPERLPDPPPVYAQQPQYRPEPPRYPPPSDPMRAQLQHPESRRYMEPLPRRAMPTWLLIPLFAFAFLGLGAAVFYGYQRFQKGGPAGFTGGETPANPKPKAGSPLQKYIEVVGIRLTQDSRRKPEARFVVVNHSTSELNDLTANVTLWATTSRSEEDSVGTFTFKLGSIGPNEAKEITTPLKTKLKIYEMPDWQNATAEVQITSP